MINTPNNWNFLNEKENWCGHFFFQDKNSSFIDTFLNKYTKKIPYQNTISLIGDCIEPLEEKYNIRHVVKYDYTGKTQTFLEKFKDKHNRDYYYFCFMLSMRFDSDIVIFNNPLYLDEETRNRLSNIVDAGMSVIFMNCKFDLSFLNDKKNVFDLNNLTLEKKINNF